jgi:hydroxyethylthiazole kinase-like uncharacterized protein yjeF
VTVAEMRKADAAAPVGVDVLVRRAGRAVANEARTMLGGSYGRRVVVVAGKGNNGADGRAAALALERWGAKVTVLDAPATSLPSADLVIDAAYGTGFRGTYRAPAVPAGVPVLAVDIPSGVDGDTGEACGEPLRADVTVTFAALKTGLVQGDGALLSGQVVVADIGLDVSGAAMWVIEDADVTRLLTPRSRDAHKWRSAVAVVAGSPGMTGAAGLCARAAYRAGAGMVRLGIPGGDPSDLPVSEAVGSSLPLRGWSSDALRMAERCRTLVVGPGLGRADATVADVRDVVARATATTVVDADGLYALGTGDEIGAVVRADPGWATVLTPHEGEFARLAGAPPGEDRIAAAASLARRCGAIVLLKGPTTVVSEPDGEVLLATAGSPRLATAGTGDVLSGAIGAFVARGVEPHLAAALAAHVHGRAADLGPAEGLVAGDLPDLLGRWLSEVRR